MSYIDNYLKSLQELDGMVSSAGMIGARYEGPAQKKDKDKDSIIKKWKKVIKKREKTN